ncbi:MAG: chromosomal replication initiation protein DnaA, partial [gamma proteobacterium symbiont of Ctena orbiculata]
MNLWQRCSEHLEQVLSPQQFNTWIRPLQIVEDQNHLKLLAPNRFVLDWVRNHYLDTIQDHLNSLCDGNPPTVRVEIGSKRRPAQKQNDLVIPNKLSQSDDKTLSINSNLNQSFIFDTFVEGKSNQIARAASMQIGENPGKAYNPLFIYGGVG